jgi:amino acid adenylation domain-containing protein
MSQALVEKSDLASGALAELPNRELSARFLGPRISSFTEQALPRLFEEQAAQAADGIAVICDSDQLTFAELNARANQLARHLRGLGVGRESLVGICIDRSLDMVIGILGILKSGGAYLPLDPDYPQERLAFMLNDARPSLVLAKSTLTDQLPQSYTRVLLLDREWPAIAENADTNLPETLRPDDLAYVIYTSGSTGEPKGVMIEHGNLANYLLALNHELRITGDDVYLHTASIAFSSSRRQLMLPLSQGAAVVIATSDQRKDPLALFEMIKHRGVTVMDAVPSFWRSCTTTLDGLEEASRRNLLDNRLRLMLSASEPLLSDIPHTWMSRFGHPARHVHMFGQTETAGIVSLYRVPDLDAELRVLPIGRPIANSEIYILDADKQPCAVDVPGELFIGGAGVGRGYLSRPELTAEKFIAHPFDGRNGARLYRTGDWARYRADGQIEFVGRRDQQVKLRGFRVELGEVETALARHSSITECVVVARPAERAGPRLIAYFVTNNPSLHTAELRSFLSARLPTHEIPSVFVQMDALPLSANGKVDRLSLPDPELARPQLSSDYVSPRTQAEVRVAAIWAEVLQVEHVGVNDNFFELGGHSLLAVQVVARVRAEFKIEISLRLLFEFPTVASLSAQIEGQIERAETTSHSLQVPTLCALEHGNEAPVSFAQQRLWFLDQIEPGGSSYNIHRAFQIQGMVDPNRLQHALEMIVARHEILRTSFVAKDGRPVQIIHPSLRLPLELLDLRELAVAECDAEVERLTVTEGQKPFDLANDRLLRVKLLRLKDDEYRLLLTIHHIISDGWSIGILLSELAALYDAFSEDQTADLPPLQIQYADFALWQRNWLKDEALEQQLTYWKQQLKDVPAALDLPTDYPRPAVQSFRGAQQSVVLSKELSDAIKAYGQQEGATLFMTLLAAFQTLLFRYSGQEDIVVGSATAGRNMVQTEPLIGFFVNPLVLRSDLSGNPSFSEVLGRTREVALGAYTHQDVPFEKLVEKLQPERGLDRSPLFQVMFTLQNTPLSEFGGNRLRITPREVPSTTAKFDLTLEVVEEGEGLRASFEYKTDLFAAATISRLLRHFQTLLEGIVNDPGQRVGELELLTAAEREQVLVEWNKTQTDYSRAGCVHELFEAQVEKTPLAIAAEFEREQISYGELNRWANQVAHYLRKQGVGRGVLVGLSVERSLEMLVGLLGILKAGGAYVPLDPGFPKERLSFMIEDARIPVLLTQEKLVSELPVQQAKVVCVDSDWELIASESAENPVGGASSEDLAYVLYTSGSTGKPKGVQIGQRALTNFLCSMRAEPGLGAEDVLLAVTTLSFDIAGLELYLPLIVGGRVVIVSREVAADGIQLKERLEESGATVMQATPATWKMLIDAGWQGSRGLKVLCGGEALSAELAGALAQRSGSLWNMYGPTETTIWSTVCKVETVEGPISIGRPLANTQVYLLDQHLNPVPLGVAGELHIGGDGLAFGYFNRPELTSEKFIQNPFSSEAGSRIYKTGDLARYLPDGKIECLGRVDDQVKIRGFRIELGEIESVLRQHASVHECVVVAREDVAGDRLLVAYVIPANEAKIDYQELRGLLQAKLPDYMSPSAIVELADFPLTPNGKVNRRALPAPDYHAQLQGSYVAPRTPVEELLCGIWAEVLKVPSVGVNDNFFELGGHSLLATQVVSRALQTFAAQLPLRALFEAPTVAGMAERIENAGEDTTILTAKPITRSARNGAVPLSFGQQSFWFLDSLTPNTSLYNMFCAVRLRGGLNVSALQQALDGLMARHESMRTIFSTVDGQPVQFIVEDQKLSLKEIDLFHLSPATREREFGQLLKDEARRPFDLVHGPLIRATLFRLDPEENVLLLSMHHIIADDWSLGILSRELKELYDSFVTGRPAQLPELPVQYADFALWQRAWLQDGALEKQLEYWKRQLAGAPALLELPTDRPRPAAPTFRGARHTLMLPLTLRDRLAKLSRQEGGTLFMTLLAAFKILLARHSGQEDIVVGSPIAGRNRIETENLIGSFINTLVLRTSLAGDPTFSELFQRVRDVALGAYAHQETPFEKLVEELQPERSLSYPPLFQAMFIFQNAPALDLNLTGLSVSRERPYNETSPLDLTLEAREMPDGLRCVFEYKTDLFDAATVERIAERFLLLLEGIVDDPAQSISDISLLTEDEKRRVLIEWNDNRAEFPRDACIHQLFEAQVERTPDAVAAVFQDEQFTYRELNQRANQLANLLRNHGVGPDTLVGICVQRSLEMLVGLLGILKAGGAYVPLDPTYPADRLAFMIEDAGLSLVLTQERLTSEFPAGRARLLCLDKDWPRIARESRENPVVSVAPANLAYVIYTSGSTGNPKGVMIEHRSLVNFTVTAASAYAIGPADRVLQFASLCFDISVEEIYPALTQGATVVLRTDEMISSARDFLRYCDQWQVTILDLPTAYWHDLTDTLPAEDLKLPAGLRLVIIGGEKAAFDRVVAWHRRVGENVRLLNTYGPTETTVVATMCDLRPQFEITSPNTVSIGRPLANAAVYLLDKSLRPVPIGAPGELHIGGPGVARGYVNRPELTAEKFIADPFSSNPHARLYKTGDLVRYRPDGNIEFLGRIDNQVKIRGFRVELEEIEQALRNHSSVTDCVVVLREAGDGDQRLIAYVVRDGHTQLTTGELRNSLKAKLPSYMVPASFEVIDALPLLPNGKINRRALPAPRLQRLEIEAFAAPADELELKLSRIWQKVLGLDSIGVDDNFFEIGGHSLLAVRLFAQIEKSFGRNLPLATLFQAPTVRQLARLLREEGWPAPWSSLVMIQGGNQRTPFFCIHAAGGNVLEYHDLARLLGPDQPFYGLQSHGLDGKSEPHTSITEMAAHYLKEMREVQPEGPYLIGGRSAGGTIAFEMACQLDAQGQKVALLALLDTYPTGYFKLVPGSGSLRQRTGRYARKLESHAKNLRGLGGVEKVAYVLRKLKYAPEKTKHKFYRRAYKIYERMGRPLPPVLKNIEEINFGAVRDYVPQTYSGDVTLFLASDLTSGYDLQDGWRELVDGSIESHEISGNHINIIKEPHVRTLAEKLKGCLERAQESQATARRAA